jgi:hypothetical protein
MPFEQRDNSGSLFKNDRKTTEKHPDYTGNLMVAGVEYRLSAWIKKGQKGTFMSLAVTPKDEQGQSGKGRSAPEPEYGSEDIPF